MSWPVRAKGVPPPADSPAARDPHPESHQGERGHWVRNGAGVRRWVSTPESGDQLYDRCP
ncbi:MAG: hypothetical protein WC451_04865 [Patescibacteria group bacterium]|jgi:hypothetical protein